MIPMIDPTMMTPGTMDTILAVGPAFAVVVATVIAGIIWFARGTAEELRRVAARDWEAAHVRTAAADHRLAA